VVNATNSLSEDVAHLKDLELRASRFVLGLIDSVCDDHFVERAGVDALDRVSAQDAVRDEGIHLRCALFLQKLCRTGNGIGGIREVVDQNRDAIFHVSDQHHGRVLPVVDLCRSALLVDEGKRHAKGIGDGGGALGSTSVGTDDDSLLVVGDVVLDVLAKEVAAVEVVDGDVEEALILGI
jgi:hypothetical protein